MSGTLIYKRGRTYYHRVQNDLKTLMWDTDAVLKQPTNYFYFREFVHEVWSYGSLYKATIINSQGEPAYYERHGIKVKEFEVCGSSIKHTLVVKYELPDGPYTHAYYNNMRFGLGTYNLSPLEYDKEWLYPAKTIVETIDEISELGLEAFKEITALRRRLCLARNTWTYEQEKDKEVLDHALFFETSLDEPVFDEEKMNLLEIGDDDYTEPCHSVLEAAQSIVEEINKLESKTDDLKRNKAIKQKVVKYYKEHLVSAKIKETVDYIPFEQFESSSKLELLVIPSSVKSIGNDAFNYSSLKEIVFLSPNPPELKWGFPNPGKPSFKAVIRIPKGSRENYRLDSFSMWGELQDQIQESNDS